MSEKISLDSSDKTVLVETMAKDYFGHCYLCYSMGRILVYF